jgi:hypothetical protein
VSGILVAGMPGLEVPASEHYGRHFNGVSPELKAFSSALVDGQLVTPAGDLDVIPVEVCASYARVAMVDMQDFADKCFVVALWARTAAQLASTPQNRDARGTPTLLADLRQGPGWRVYNCQLTLTSWSKDRLFNGDYPPVP